jgi:archaellum component FlaC
MLKIEVTHTHKFDCSGDGVIEVLAEILSTLQKIKHQNFTIMSKQEEITAQLSRINDSTNNIAADLQRLADQISGGLSASEADGVVSQLKAAADKLSDIAAINPETGEPGTGDGTGTTPIAPGTTEPGL